MILAYDGARYDGWQKQGNTERTIQGKLEAALGRLTGETVELQGAGRTDAGVHARGQAASFHLASERDCRELLEELNRYLPEDLAVLSLERAPERFHARLNALGKRYRYQLAFGSRKPVFERKYLYREEKPLDFEAMEQAARYLEGTTRFPLLLRQPADEKIYGADPLPHRTAGRSPAGPGGSDLRGRRVSVSHGADPDGDPAGGGDGKAEAVGDPGDPGGPGPGSGRLYRPSSGTVSGKGMVQRGGAMKDVKGMIFDLDGTLLDSMGVWSQIDVDFLAKRGLDLPEDYQRIVTPMGGPAGGDYTIERFHLPDTPEMLMEEWLEMAHEEYSRRIPLKPWATSM